MNFNTLNTLINPKFDTQAFMRDTWGKHPLVIRNAFDFSINAGNAPITAAQILSLATQPNTQARLIAHKTLDGQAKWSLKHSPLTSLPKPTQNNWTVLVQNVELFSATAHALLQQFAFARFAELDDLMVSYATQGGGVGAHVDSYDVFLLQGQGQRRWRISQQTDLTLIPKLPLKILKNFEAEQEWVLNPGDMLYLPPNIAHEGVALSDDCLTYSIGYRAPRLHDALDDMLGMLTHDDGDDDSPQLKLPAPLASSLPMPACLDGQDIIHYRQALNQWLNDAVLEEHLGCLLTRPNREHAIASPRGKLKTTMPLTLASGTRMLYSAGFIFIEGLAFAAEGLDWQVLSQLANTRCLPAGALETLSAGALEIVQDWLQEGWCIQ